MNTAQVDACPSCGTRHAQRQTYVRNYCPPCDVEWWDEDRVVPPLPSPPATTGTGDERERQEWLRAGRWKPTPSAWPPIESATWSVVDAHECSACGHLDRDGYRMVEHLRGHPGVAVQCGWCGEQLDPDHHSCQVSS